MSSSLSRSTKYAASRSASGSGAATTRNAVPSAWSSSKVFWARARKPPNRVSKAATKVCMSLSTVAPRILVSALVIMPIPADISFGRAAGRRQQQPDEPAVEEAGEPLRCVEEVERRPRRRGVDHDQVVGAGLDRVAVELAELLHRHVLLRARRTSSTARCRRGSPGSAWPSPGWPGSPPPRRRCASCRASSRRGCRVPPTSGTGRGVLSSASMPIDCASRRAGSMVSTQTLRPRSAARRARAADVVVLPTPPEPQHTMIRVPGSSSRSSMSSGSAWSPVAASGPTRARWVCWGI